MAELTSTASSCTTGGLAANVGAGIVARVSRCACKHSGVIGDDGVCTMATATAASCALEARNNNSESV